MKKYRVALVGATGAVGQSLISILEQRDFPISQIYFLASARSAGKTINFSNGKHTIELLDNFDFNGVDVAFFSAGSDVSEVYALKAQEAGTIVIDNTSHFRYDDSIPLVVPEVNPQALDMLSKTKTIIANPNCSTIQMLVALNPIRKEAGIARINVATYQAVSGSGGLAIEELSKQNNKIAANQNITAEDVKIYPQQIAANVIPQIDVFLENDYTKEEMKMVWETHKIFDDKDILVNPTCVRVPVNYGHSEAIHFETKEKITAKRVKELLQESDGVKVVDDTSIPSYPTPLTDAAYQDPVFVGRIRKDISSDNGINMWVVADNIRKGAALNSIQIAELLISQNRI